MRWVGTWPRPTAESMATRSRTSPPAWTKPPGSSSSASPAATRSITIVQHTALVTLCVQDILRGRRLERTVTPSDWGHTILAALTHDIGYVRGICAGDTAEHFVIDAAGNTVTPPRGASDAFLMPYHVERGKIMVRERFAPVPFIDEERIAAAIELTRFPVPDDEDHAATDTEAGLVRAGDLIGQLGDPLYPRKFNALYHEFVETGVQREARLYAAPPIWSTAIRNSIGARSSAISATRCVISR